MKKVIASFFAFTFFCVTGVLKQTVSNNQIENPKIKWFREAKFGMLIHWDLFAQHAGTYKRKKYYGISE